MRPFVKLPTHRHRQHLLSQRRDETSGQIKRKIPVLQHGVGTLIRFRAVWGQGFNEWPGIHRSQNKTLSGHKLKTLLKKKSVFPAPAGIQVDSEMRPCGPLGVRRWVAIGGSGGAVKWQTGFSILSAPSNFHTRLARASSDW